MAIEVRTNYSNVSINISYDKNLLDTLYWKVVNQFVGVLDTVDNRAAMSRALENLLQNFDVLKFAVEFKETDHG